MDFQKGKYRTKNYIMVGVVWGGGIVARHGFVQIKRLGRAVLPTVTFSRLTVEKVRAATVNVCARPRGTPCIVHATRVTAARYRYTYTVTVTSDEKRTLSSPPPPPPPPPPPSPRRWPARDEVKLSNGPLHTRERTNRNTMNTVQH